MLKCLDVKIMQFAELFKSKSLAHKAAIASEEKPVSCQQLQSWTFALCVEEVFIWQRSNTAPAANLMLPADWTAWALLQQGTCSTLGPWTDLIIVLMVLAWPYLQHFKRLGTTLVFL